MIRELNKDEQWPLDLLLLADPSIELVREYVSRGQCFVYELDGKVIGTHVLIPTRPDTTEIVNVSVDKDYQGRGYGKQLSLHAIATAKLNHY